MVPSNLNTEAFKNLTPQEQKVALEILKQYSDTGYSDLFNDLKYADFDEIPVDICTFMHDKKYLGNALYDAEGRFTVYPYWEKCLEDIFPDNLTTKYNNIVLTGAIGLGKSTIAVIVLLYMLYRLLCLKDPYAYYGMQPIDKITISLMNITLDNAKGVALDKMNQMILASDWFMAHGEMSGITNLVYRPEKHIEIIVASSNNQIIGRALFCLDGDTVIATTAGDKKIKDLVGKQINVISYDKGKNIISQTCTVAPTIKAKEEYQIELEDGSIIKCTPNHRLMLKDGTYKEAQYLTEDDELADIQLTYSSFIKNIINTRGQWGLNHTKEYCERHHILPKCLGGLPKRLTWAKHQNIIWLTAKEHFIAHKLLALENPNCYELVSAFKRMCYSNHNKEVVTEDNIDFIKQNWARLHAEHLKGTKHSHHIIKDVDAYRLQKSKQMKGINNNMYGKGYKIAGDKNGCYGKSVEPTRLEKIKKARSKFIYTYDNMEFYGWVDLKNYLHAKGYNISQAGIEACIIGKPTIKNKYPTLFLNITKRRKENLNEDS